jgi:putative membrane protein
MSADTRPLSWIVALLWGLVGLAFVASGWHPFDRGTWVLEVTPVVIAVPLL